MPAVKLEEKNGCLYKVHQKKLNILLLAVSAICYYKVCFTAYKWIVFDLLTLKMETIVVLDMIFIAIFILSVVPCSFGLKYLLRKFLTKQA